MTLAAVAVDRWVEVCGVGDLTPGRGVCALVHGHQVAVFLVDGRVYALGNLDPFSGANVLSRGIVGDRGGRLKVASPVYKQSFDLATGCCLDDPGVAVPTYPARVRQGRVQVGRVPSPVGPVGPVGPVRPVAAGPPAS